MEAQKLKYFTKFFPVEGEMTCSGECKTKFKFTDKLAKECINCGGLLIQHNKLFLCSRDIQIGDKVKSFNYPEQYEGELVNLRTSKKLVGAKDHSEIYHLADIQYPNDSHCITAAISNFFKVIGEISPEAKWVKEGDEFDEEQLGWLVWDTRFPEDDDIFYDFSDEPEIKGKHSFKVICIMGPCGHFH